MEKDLFTIIKCILQPKKYIIVLKNLKKIGKKVFLINTVIQEIDYDLSIFDAIYTRESLSSQGKYPVVHDACFHTILDNSNNKEEYVLFLDSVLPEVNKKILKAYESYNGNKKHVKMDQNKYNLEEFIDLCQNASFIVTGRYHGAVFSIMCEKKFIAIESNTHKISGLLKDLDLMQNLTEDLNNLEEKILLAKKPKVDTYKIKKDIEHMIDFCLLLYSRRYNNKEEQENLN